MEKNERDSLIEYCDIIESELKSIYDSWTRISKTMADIRRVMNKDYHFRRNADGSLSLTEKK